MTNEEREYQIFFAKAIKAGKEFADDYNKLSPNNKLKFQNDLRNQAAFKALINIFNTLQN